MDKPKRVVTKPAKYITDPSPPTKKTRVSKKNTTAKKPKLAKSAKGVKATKTPKTFIPTPFPRLTSSPAPPPPVRTTTGEQLSDIHFSDDVDMKLLLLSLFAHDPCHDFQTATRTFGKKNDKSGAGQDIFDKLNYILDTVSTKRIVNTSTPQKYDTFFEATTANEMASVSKDYVKTEFVPQFTNLIFSDTIAESIHLSSGYSINETIDAIQATTSNNQESMFDISERITKSINDNLEKYSIISLSFYDVYAIPIKAVLNTQYATKRGQINTELFKALQGAIIQAETGLAEFLYEQIDSVEPFRMYRETPEEDAKLIQYIQSRPVNRGGDPCIATIQKINTTNYREKEIANCIDTYLRQYRLTYHVDKAQQNATFLKSVFKYNTLDELRAILTRDNQDYLDKITIFAKKLKSLYGDKQSGGGQEEKEDTSELSEMNKHLLVEIVRWVLLYLNCAYEENGVGLLPTFAEVFATDDNKIKAKKYILNAQIMILYCFYYQGTGYKAALTNIINKRHTSLSKKKFPEYMSTYLMEEDSANGVNMKRWLSSDIDSSIKESSEIIIRNMLPEYILYDGDNIANAQVIDINALINTELNNNVKRYIINNASPIGPKSFPNADTNIEKSVYCPVTSIADAMFNCGYSDAVKEKSDAIYPMKVYIENDAGPKYIYSIEIYPSKTDRKNLSINGVVTVEGNPITIDIYKNLNVAKYKDKELSATIAYRDTVTQIVDLLQSPEINTISNLMRAERVTKMDKFRNFVRMMAKQVIQFVCIKSIGDWGQEVTSVAKLGAYYKNDIPAINAIMNETNTVPYDDQGDALRLGVAGDRPSAFRMIYMNMFAKPETKNAKSIVGYVTQNAENNFLVYTPTSYPRSYVSDSTLARYREMLKEKVVREEPTAATKSKAPKPKDTKAKKSAKSAAKFATFKNTKSKNRKK